MVKTPSSLVKSIDQVGKHQGKEKSFYQPTERILPEYRLVTLTPSTKKHTTGLPVSVFRFTHPGIDIEKIKHYQANR